MWWWSIVASAAEPGVPGQVTLWAAVPIDAGGVEAIAVDGAAGQCAIGPSRLTCPASGPVTFRWGPDDGRAVLGDGVLNPGEAGVAWLLTAEEAAAVDGWRAAATDAPAAIDRREAILALRAWCWSSGVGPLPSTAPVPVPAGFLADIADDPAWVVRRAALELIRDFRDPDGSFEGELADVLVALARDPDRRVAKAGYAVLAAGAKADHVPAAVAWAEAIAAVEQPGARGRSATVTLARLAPLLTAGDDIDPISAVELAIAHHPEQAWRVWSAWRADVPFREAWARVLITRTLSLNQRLLRDWADREPRALARLIREWEPDAPHSERYGVVGEWLSTATDAELRASLGLAPAGS